MNKSSSNFNPELLYQKNFWLIIIILNAALISCNQSSQHHWHLFKSTKHDSTDRKYQQNLNMHAGDKYYFTISNETTTTYTIDAKKAESSNKNRSGLLYDVVGASSDTFLIRITYKRFHVTAKSNGNVEDIDADNAANSLDPSEKMLGLLKNSYLLVTVDKKGKVTNIQGQKEITDKIVSVYADDESSAKQVQAQFQTMFDANNIEQNIVGIFKILPDSAVYVGDTWNKTTAAPENTLGLNLNMTTNYTLESAENNIAQITSKSEFNQEDTIKQTGIPVQVTLKGKEEGDYKTDLLTGVPISIKNTLILKGKVHSLKEVPLTIKQEKEITVKKL